MVSEKRWAGQWLAILGMSLALGACGATKAASKDGAGGDGSGSEPDVTMMMAPAARGAGVFSLRAQSPAIPGKACPVAVLTSSIPRTSEANTLDGNTYLEHIVDGEGSAAMSCKVSGNLRFAFEGSLQLGGVALKIKNGTLGDDRRGSADITVTNSQGFPGSLASAAPCSIDATSTAGQAFQVKAGSMWAGFDCPSVEQVPSDSCAASGVFVLENCEQ